MASTPHTKQTASATGATSPARATAPAAATAPASGASAPPAPKTRAPSDARRGPRRAPVVPGGAAGADVDLEALRRDLRTAILAHYPDADLAPVDGAFDLAVEAHTGQRRATGEPYVTHPIASAQILADLGVDPVAIE